MATDEAPEIVQVPVKRYDVNLTLDDLLTPLIELSARRAQEKVASAEPSEIDQHVQQLSDLARQLKDVINRINAADPTVLAAPKQGQPVIR